MRPLEIAVALLAGLSLLLYLLPPARRPAWARGVPTALAVCFALQLTLEGHRWQLDLAYPVCAGLLLASWLGPRTRWHHAVAVALALSGLLALAGTVLLASGSPMFELPEPSGPHRVGVTTLHLVDPSREEPFTVEPDDRRELTLTVWYPAAPIAEPGEPAPYWNDADVAGPLMAKLTREAFGMTVLDNAFDHYADVPTHSWADAPPAPEPRELPVLVYSHGYGAARPTSNTALFEDLASRGYFVASVSHPYETPAVVFEDGRVASWQPDAVMGLLRGQDPTFFERYVETPDPAARDALVREFLAAQTSTSTSMRVWLADTRSAVDEIERIASGERRTPFAGRLDLDRLGVLGMSFGGATAGVFCVEDRRCKAGLNLDGFQYGDGMADAVVRVPFMIVSAKRDDVPLNDFFFRHAAGPTYLVEIADSTHMNFTDTSIAAPSLRWVGALGEIDGHRMLHILNAYVAAFFDRHLLERRSPLLEAPSADYPEVELDFRNTDA
jgi:predicted dienelactone hydrolase